MMPYCEPSLVPLAVQRQHWGLGMDKTVLTVPELLDKLEARYGCQKPGWPADPYLFIVWWHCGYPASDARCAKGWAALNQEIGADPEQILAARPVALAHALRPGSMVPELRAMRLKEIAARIKDEFGSDLRSGLVGPMVRVRKALKKFPNIADPGADRILLFGEIAPVAAVPSNCPHVLVRIRRGQERENYRVTYHEAQETVAAEIPETFSARMRAYLLLKRHGQELCKRTKPKFEDCPVSSACAYFAGKRRGRASRIRV
jgi:endonuclease III